MKVSDDYLASVAESGLLADYAGRAYVAGPYLDEATGELQCLVEHCDTALLRDDLAGFTHELRLAHPDAGALVLSADAQVTLPAPWRPRITYLEHAGQVPEARLAVVPAEPEHRSLLTEWIAQALRAAVVKVGGQSDEEAIARLTATVLDVPSRLSFVALHEGEPIGHGTVFSDSCDQVTGVEHVELFDVLIAREDLRGDATAALVRAAVEHARDLGKPLIGHVVHPHGSDEGDRIVASLVARGWRADRVFWRLGGEAWS